jgi:ElaB/YqjD/DUF883 family membrane-anchored ribosome-binding protein
MWPGSKSPTRGTAFETSIRNNPIASVAVAAAIGFLYAMIRRQWFIGDGM